MKEVERVRINYLVYCFFIIILLMCFLFPTFVSADMCSDEELVRLKVLANNISVHYEYLDADDESLDWGNTIPYGYNYAITISGISEGLAVASDDDDYQEFDYSNSVDGTVSFYIQNNSGSLSLNIFPSDCSTSFALRSISLTLPVLNDYYHTVECDAIRSKKIDLDVCHRTVPSDFKISDIEFYNIVGKYLVNEKKRSVFSEFLSNYFSNFYFILGTVIIFIIVIIMISFGIRRSIKRRRLE